jgi:hypothetical protein
MARPSLGSLCLLLLVAVVERSLALRTGVAPTYIPTMRQISSYETSNIDTQDNAVVQMRELEKETYHQFLALGYTERHKLEEYTHNTALRAENAILRSTLTTTKNTKVYNDDQSYREINRNKGLEPQNVALTVTKTTQDNYIYQTNKTNRILDMHYLKTLEHNNRLLAEKKDVWLSLERNERDEWFYHENAIAVEVQNPAETKSMEYHLEQNLLHDQFVSDMKTRNAGLAAQVPGLTTDRDLQEATKLSEIVKKNDFNMQAERLELQVPSLQKSVSALEKLVMQYQMANSDLTNYNAKQTAEINTLDAERDALRASFEEMVDQRNAAQIEADHWEVLFTDMKQKKKMADQALNIKHIADDGANAQEQVCWSKNSALRDQRNVLKATNKNLIDNCY